MSNTTDAKPAECKNRVNANPEVKETPQPTSILTNRKVETHPLSAFELTEAHFETLFRTDSPLYALNQRSPFRPVDWRWHLAIYASERSNGIPKAWITHPVNQAKQFIKQLCSCRTSTDHIRLSHRYPRKYQAIRLRLSEYPEQRAEMEARILAGQSHQEISAKTGLSSEAIAIFESWLFDVKHRSPSFVNYGLLRIHECEEWWDTKTIWKYWAFRGGPVVLEAVMREFPATVKPHSADEMAEYLATHPITRLMVRVMVLYHMLPVNQQTAPKILRLFQDHKRQQAKPQPPSLIGTLSENVRAVLEGMPRFVEAGETEDGTPQPESSEER